MNDREVISGVTRRHAPHIAPCTPRSCAQSAWRSFLCSGSGLQELQWCTMIHVVCAHKFAHLEALWRPEMHPRRPCIGFLVLLPQKDSPICCIVVKPPSSCGGCPLICTCALQLAWAHKQLQQLRQQAEDADAVLQDRSCEASSQVSRLYRAFKFSEKRRRHSAITPVLLGPAIESTPL